MICHIFLYKRPDLIEFEYIVRLGRKQFFTQAWQDLDFLNSACDAQAVNAKGTFQATNAGVHKVCIQKLVPNDLRLRLL